MRNAPDSSSPFAECNPRALAALVARNGRTLQGAGRRAGRGDLAGEHVNAVLVDKTGKKKTPACCRRRFRGPATASHGENIEPLAADGTGCRAAHFQYRACTGIIHTRSSPLRGGRRDANEGCNIWGYWTLRFQTSIDQSRASAHMALCRLQRIPDFKGSHTADAPNVRRKFPILSM